MKNVAAGANPMIIKKGIDEAVKTLVDEIKAKSKKVEGQADIAQVATISSANEETGKLIAEAMEKVGKDGVITVEESKTCLLYTSWYPPFNTGAGYAMGIRAGAEMTTLEHRFIALRCKDTIAPTGTIAQGCLLYTSRCV